MRSVRLVGMLASALFLLPLTVQCCAQATAQRIPPDAANTSSLVMGPGDLIDVNVYDVPELILKVRVGDDGSVTLPLVGRMQWAGLTATEADHELAAALIREQFVRAPQVSVFIAEYATQGVSVTGEVNQPGIYPLLGPHTLFDAISAAGGVTENASNLITIAHKSDPQHPEHAHIAANGTIEHANRPIQPGDMITVGKAGLVYVVGEVNHPGGFVMSNDTHLTLVKAVALALGPTSHGRLKQVCIVRHQDGQTVLIEVNLKQAMRGRAADLQLQAEDIVYVPNSAIRTTTDIMQKASIGAAAAAVIAF